MSWWSQLRALLHVHSWVLVIDPPDAPGGVFMQCSACGYRSGGWRHGRPL